MPSPRKLRHRIRRAIAALAVSAAYGAPAAPFDIETLQGALASVQQRHHIAGYALAIVDRQGPVFLGGGGVARREGAVPVDADTVWRVGSITKVFTGIATIIAAREQGYALDAPVRSLVPDAPFENPWEATDPVRVAQLMEHTAGFLDLSKREFDSSDPSPLSLAQAFAVNPASRIVQWPPGRFISYTNTGAGIASLVIEKATGQRYEDFVRTRILDPLGMTHSGYFLDEPTRSHLAGGYDKDGVTPIPYWHTIYRAFGGLNVTVADMARFLHWMLVPERKAILSSTELARLETPGTTLSARAGLEYGYAMGIYHYVHDGVPWKGHGGDADGYLSRFGVVRQAGIAYFIVINAFNGDAMEEMQTLIERELTKHVERAPIPPVARLTREELCALEGRYEAVTRRFTWAGDADDPVLNFRVEGDHLIAATPLGREKHYYPVTRRHFRRDNEPVPTSAFVEDADGALVFQGDMGNLKRPPLEPAASCRNR
ncbi:MAG: serine hydrolase domain-containing protein [Burkholderiales bacterium]